MKDITLKNNKLTRDLREGAAEFEITPLITDLRKNRPLGKLESVDQTRLQPIPKNKIPKSKKKFEKSLNLYMGEVLMNERIV